jgi:hypothetical protein
VPPQCTLKMCQWYQHRMCTGNIFPPHLSTFELIFIFYNLSLFCVPTLNNSHHSFLKKFEFLSSRRTCGLDVARANQATLEVCSKFEKVVQSTITNLLVTDLVHFPWTTLAEIPSDHKFNMDEIGFNGETGRLNQIAATKVIIPSLYLYFIVVQ